MSSARLDRVMAEGYADDLQHLPIDEVRARRSECQDVELGLSYARRLVQGYLDIIHDELERRRAGGGPSDASHLVDRLKEGEILSDHARPPGFGRLPGNLAPQDAADEFMAELDEVADANALARLPELADDEVGVVGDRLTTLERSLSDRRRQVHDRIDAFQAEIVRRYKTGTAHPDELLT